MSAMIRKLTQTTLFSPLHNPISLLSRRGIAFKLFVGGLSYHTTEKSLSNAFTQFGQVIEATVVYDPVSERSKGFGFVTYASIDEAENAVIQMDGKVLDGRPISVDHKKPILGFGNYTPIARGPPDNHLTNLDAQLED